MTHRAQSCRWVGGGDNMVKKEANQEPKLQYTPAAGGGVGQGRDHEDIIELKAVAEEALEVLNHLSRLLACTHGLLHTLCPDIISTMPCWSIPTMPMPVRFFTTFSRAASAQLR